MSPKDTKGRPPGHASSSFSRKSDPSFPRQEGDVALRRLGSRSSSSAATAIPLAAALLGTNDDGPCSGIELPPLDTRDQRGRQNYRDSDTATPASIPSALEPVPAALTTASSQFGPLSPSASSPLASPDSFSPLIPTSDPPPPPHAEANHVRASGYYSRQQQQGQPAKQQQRPANTGPAAPPPTAHLDRGPSSPDNMAPRPPSLVPRVRPNRLPYGSVSLPPHDHHQHAHGNTPSPTAVQGPSPLAPDAASQPPWTSTPRAKISDASRLSASSARKARHRRSEELDTATLTTGLDGRFGLAENPIPHNLDGHKSSDDGDGDGDNRRWDRPSCRSGEDDGDDVEDDDGDDDDNDDDDGDHSLLSDRDLYEDSPHETVRASVPSTDNTTLSIKTPRMWVLSTLFAILGSSTNLFFSLRYPSVAITPVIALLLVHPLGRAWDYLLKRPGDPDEEFLDGDFVHPAYSSSTSSSSSSSSSPSFSRATHRWRSLESWRRWLAQGRWNEKEHTCVYVSSNVSFGFAFATDVIVEQTKFYNQEATLTYQLLLTLSTQILGYTFAGLTRSFLVRPSGMIWPGTLMAAAMFTTLHKEENKPANGWTVSRWGFFYTVFLASFAFYFLPGLLIPALSYFNVVTWFAPKNVVVANLFGVSSGLGLFPVTFDWAQITYIGSPLLPPFWAAMNVIGGLVVVMWIAAPIAYYCNFLYSSYMPILSASVFDNTGAVYNVGKILTEDFVFDRDAYRRYSRVFLPITYVLSYGMQFAALAALLTHTVCWHGADIWHTWKQTLREVRGGDRGAYRPVATAAPGARYPSSSASSARTGRGRPSSLGGASDVSTCLDDAGNHRSNDDFASKEDVHTRLMKRYKDAPMSWYLLTFVTMLAIGIFLVEYYPVHLPWYGLLLALAICAVFFIPNGIVMAVTNTHNSTYLICQLVCGVVFPGRPIANMLFVTYGYISSAQGIKFASDLKLGHYMKIPPRILFAVQMVATAVSSVTQIAVLNWMFARVDGLCTPSAVNGFTCPIARVHFNGSILWGVVGPAEFFGPRGPYRGLVWCFLAGAVLPLPLWLYARRNPASLVRKVNLPVLFGSMAWIPPATGLNFSVWAVVSYLFNYRVRRRAGEWWAKYNMTLSAALDSGLAFGIVVVFFGFVYPGWMRGFSWWGTEVYKQGCDWQACPYRTVPEGGKFGPDEW